MAEQPRSGLVTRRRVLAGSVLAAAAGLTLAAPAPAAAAVRLRLPGPTGVYAVGTASVRLVDGSRVDPLAPAPRSRELLVRLWYPAVRSSGRPVAGYLTPGHAGALVAQLNALLGTDHPAGLLRFPTHSRDRAPAARGSRRPILVFSPGFGNNAALHTAILEELASRGYVVAGIDHTFDAAVVEFPGGRLETQSPHAADDPVRLTVRVDDTRFVLDQLAAIAAGRNPDADGRPLPAGLGPALDLTRVGAFGHSLGSMTTVGAIDTDARIGAGAVLDGNPLGSASVARPVLMLGNQGHRRADDPDWAAFYDRLRGPRLHLVIDGAEHADLSDLTVFKAVIDLGAVFGLGPIDGNRSLAIQRRYLAAWFDRAMHGRPNSLLRGESARFPEVDFQP